MIMATKLLAAGDSVTEEERGGCNAANCVLDPSWI